MRGIWQDFRYGIRMFAKRPGLTLVAVCTLALGIGVNSSLFSVVNGILLRRPTLPNLESLVWCFAQYPGNPYESSSYLDYLDFRERNSTMRRLAAEGRLALSIETSGMAQPVWALAVSGNYFTTLGAEALEHHFASDPQVIGDSIVLNGRHFLVNGIAPRGFRSTSSLFSPDLWIPLQALADIQPGSGYLGRERGWLYILGQLQGGVSIEQAQVEFSAIAGELASDHPTTNRDRGMVLAAMSKGHPEGRSALVKLSIFSMSMVMLVLLIACFNVANLLIARSTERQKEISIRSALGAGRARLLRQMVCESLLLALLAGILGLLLGNWSTELLAAFKPPAPIPQAIDLSLDFRILGFALALSLLAGILPGVASAWQASKVDFLPALKDAALVFGRGSQKSRLRDFMVITEVAVSLILITAAGLLLRSWSNYAKADPGFDADNALVMTVRPGLQNYDHDRAFLFFRELLERIESLGAVQSATLTDRVPLGIGGNRTVVSTNGEDCSLVKCPEVGTFAIGPGYFQTLGIPVLSGRPIEGPIRKQAESVAVINESMARRFWPDRDPVGLWLKIGEEGRQALIIGVTGDAKFRMLNEDPEPTIYLPLRTEAYGTGLTVVTRVRDEPRRYLTALREQVNALDPGMPVFELKTMSEHLELALWAPRAAAVLIGTFGVLALLLTVAGYYGVIFCSVSQRTRELAIRGALGATGGTLILMILRQGMRLTVAGMLIGLAGALALAHLIAQALFGVSQFDPVAFAGAGLLLGITTIIACYIPARRATKADPWVALRQD